MEVRNTLGSGRESFIVESANQSHRGDMSQRSHSHMGQRDSQMAMRGEETANTRTVGMVIRRRKKRRKMKDI